MAFDGSMGDIFSYVHDAFAKMADAVGKAADGAAKTGEAAVKNAGNSLSFVENTAPDDGTNGATATSEKAKRLHAKAGIKSDFRRAMVCMVRNASINKILIMGGGFAALSVVPEAVFENSWPLFAVFGAHLSYEAIKQFNEKSYAAGKKFYHKIQRRRGVEIADAEPHESAEELSFAKIVKTTAKKDRDSTAEITAALVGYIYPFPQDEQAEIMAGFGAVMLASYPAVFALIEVDFKGKELQQRDYAGRPVKQFLVQQSGRAICATTKGVVQTLMAVGTVAKFSTGGRVEWHASEAAGILSHHSLDHVGLMERLKVWGIMGAVTGAGLHTAVVLGKTFQRGHYFSTLHEERSHVPPTEFIVPAAPSSNWMMFDSHGALVPLSLDWSGGGAPRRVADNITPPPRRTAGSSGPSF